MSVLRSMGALLESSRQSSSLIKFGGSIVALAPGMYTVAGLSQKVSLGNLVQIGKAGLGQVVRSDGELIYICPFDTEAVVKMNDPVFFDPTFTTKPNINWLGRVLDSLGRPIDDGSPILYDVDTAPAFFDGTGVLQRKRVSEALKTGVRVIDIFTPICRGQRLGIFAGSGVGKSTLLSMLAKSNDFDVVVVALVGERIREVREFLEDSIGPEGMEKSVVIVSTSDESPMLRRRAPELAMDVCETFSRMGRSVLLLVDSLTRYAHALREIGICNGEPPVARGYPSSVFSQLPKLLERAGPGKIGDGAITAITTVLVDGDDHNDPISDAVRGTIDGHLVLDRSIAEEARYPPIHPLSSISRLSSKVWSKEEGDLVLQLRKMISLFEETKDLRMLGGWTPGADPELDKAVETVPLIYKALCQSPSDPLSENAFDDLVQFLKHGQEPAQHNVA